MPPDAWPFLHQVNFEPGSGKIKGGLDAADTSTDHQDISKIAIAKASRELLDDLFGHAGQSGDVDAVALVGRAVDDLVQKDHVVLPLADRYVEVLYARERLLQISQFVVVRGEQRAAAGVLVQILEQARPPQ